MLILPDWVLQLISRFYPLLATNVQRLSGVSSPLPEVRVLYLILPLVSIGNGRMVEIVVVIVPHSSIPFYPKVR